MRSADGLSQRFSWFDLDERGCVRGLFRDSHTDIAILIEVAGAGNPPNPCKGCTLTFGGERTEARNLPMAKALAELALLIPKIPERQGPSQVLIELGLLIGAVPQQASRHAR
jgi:hypothetical protein